MKKLILSLVLLLTLVSCEVYDQPKTLSLSGEYIIDRITRTSTENTSGTQQLVVYQPGDTFISNAESFPMDMIVVGATRWHFDYSVISFSPIGLNNGRCCGNTNIFITYIMIGIILIWDILNLN